jgi:hypothetical protein
MEWLDPGDQFVSLRDRDATSPGLHWRTGPSMRDSLAPTPLRPTPRSTVQPAKPARPKPQLAEFIAKLLAPVAEADAAFFSGTGEDRKVLVVAREHGLISRDHLLDIEETIEREFGCFVEICVRAHQGRGLAPFAGLERIL